MKELKKWFNFGGTIDGLQYLTRTFLGFYLAIPGILLAAIGGESALGVFGIAVAIIPAIVLGISTSIKRIRGVFQNTNPWIVWGGLAALALVSNMGGMYLGIILGLVNLVFSLIITFTNTDLDHKG